MPANDDELRRQAYLKALQNLSGEGMPSPLGANPNDLAGRVFTPGQGWKPGPRSSRVEELPGMQAQADMPADPYDLLKLKEEQDKMAGRVFTPGVGWKKNSSPEILRSSDVQRKSQWPSMSRLRSNWHQGSVCRTD